MTVPVSVLRATLPGGKTIKLRELSGADEMAVSVGITLGADGMTAGDSLQNTWASIHRSLMEIDGKPFEASAHTPESMRNLFSAKEFKLVVDAYQQLHTPTIAEADTFRKAFEVSAEEIDPRGRIPRAVRKSAG